MKIDEINTKNNKLLSDNLDRIKKLLNENTYDYRKIGIMSVPIRPYGLYGH